MLDFLFISKGILKDYRKKILIALICISSCKDLYI